MGRSKLRTHCFLSKNEIDKCRYCETETDDLTHFLINCPEYIVYRNKFDENNKSIISIIFQFMPANVVISSILNLSAPVILINTDKIKFQNFCIEFIECLQKHAFSG